MSSVGRVILWFTFVLIADSAVGQTTLHTAPALQSEPCTNEGDLADCGLRAEQNKDYEIARSAWSRAAEKGDHIAAFWLAGMYQDGHLSDDGYVQAYKWYDIAAALHGIEIDKLPPGSDQDNKVDINYRDDVARHLTPAQIADAQRMSREWLARRGAVRK
jgi:hypothetical protein